jgi:diguanylate cyclase (GGDEF)-like protein
MVGYRRRPIHLALAVILAVLFGCVELLVLVSYQRSSVTAQRMNDATDTTTALASISRESLLIRERVLTMDDPREGGIDIDLHRALLDRQLSVLAASSSDVALLAGIDRFRSILASLDVGIERIRASGAADIEAETARMREPLDQMELQAKRLFDSEEHRLYTALADDLAGSRRTQVQLVVLAGLVLLLGTTLAIFLRRSVRADFANAHEALVAEMTEREALQDQLGHQVHHDPITGLANTRLFVREVERALDRAKRHPGTVAVAYLDLDGFKAVNDSLGHAAGDELLKQVGARLESQIRSTDIAARLGGDEFALLFADSGTEQDVLTIADRIVTELALPYAILGRTLKISASLGIVPEAAPGIEATELIKDADLAMYSAKDAGKNQRVNFNVGMREEAEDRSEIERELERAILEHEFVLHYQPIVELRSGRVEGMEALVRWAHPSGELRPPAAFIDIAEETGLIDAIGDQVFEMATETMAGWHGAFPEAADIFVSVNASARQFSDESFGDRIAQMLTRSGLRPEALVIEVTESTMMGETDEAVQILRELRGHGVRIAIDDFGTGYSSLSYLRFMPVDFLKLDRSFVASLNEDNGIAAAIAQLANSLGIRAVAEGIERPEQWDLLMEMGWVSGQGFLIARPQPAALAIEHLRSGLVAAV